MKITPRVKVLTAIVVVLVMGLAQLVVLVTSNAPEELEYDDMAADNSISIISFDPINGSSLSLECVVADTPEERQAGLMYVTSLPEDEGMLFILEEPRNVTMWMKNTEIPLDMIFVDENLRVINIEEAVVEPTETPDSELTRYQSNSPVLYIIETNMGFCSKNGIVPGAVITITFS